MKLTYPYGIEINTKEEAVDYIMHQCRNCIRYSSNWDCSGATANKCQHSVNLVVAEFCNKWIYETGKEEYDVTNGHSSYYNVEKTNSEEEVFKIAKEKHNDFIRRKAKIGDESIEQTYYMNDGWL